MQFTVYLGPAVKAKEYFESLGFIFPDAVNPADYLMDIIGGEAEHPTDPTLTSAELPAKWEADTQFNSANAAAGSAAASPVPSSADGEELLDARSDASEGHREPNRLVAEQMGIYVMDVLVKGEWQEVPMGTTVGSVGVMNNPSPNRGGLQGQL